MKEIGRPGFRVTAPAHAGVRRSWIFAALAAVLAANPSSAADMPSISVKALDDKTVVVRGAGFQQDRLLVSADDDMPHASVACRSDFTRIALVKGGAFEVTINPSAASGCRFSCGREPSGYIVAVETWDGKALAEAKFPCVAAPRPHARFRSSERPSPARP